MIVEEADTFLRRLTGLMFRRSMSSGYGLMLYPCSRIHTCFMCFPIDALYLDETYTVLGKETVEPWRIGKNINGTKMTFEMAAGAAEKIEIGMKLLLGADIQVLAADSQIEEKQGKKRIKA